jgi:hypothetical protein
LLLTLASGVIHAAAATEAEFVFDDSPSPMLVLRRAGTLAPLAAGQTCASLEKSFFASRRGEGEGIEKLASAWEPWSDDDREGVVKCEEFPCAVKLDAAETAALLKAPEAKRLETYLRLVRTRAEAYRKSGRAQDYEFSTVEYGAVREPFSEWAKLLKRGAPPAASARLWVRKLTAQNRTLRQVIERRESRTGTTREIWIRALYNDHFFDAWGEWAAFQCGKDGWKVELAMLVDVDLLKKTDVFSQLGRGKMKSASQEILQGEMKRWLEEIAKAR